MANASKPIAKDKAIAKTTSNAVNAISGMRVHGERVIQIPNLPNGARDAHQELTKAITEQRGEDITTIAANLGQYIAFVEQEYQVIAATVPKAPVNEGPGLMNPTEYTAASL